VSRDFLFQFFHESLSPSGGKFSTGVNYTDGKFATGINNYVPHIPLMSLIPVAYFPLVSTTPVANNWTNISQSGCLKTFK
jgi:hypothetical protein